MINKKIILWPVLLWALLISNHGLIKAQNQLGIVDSIEVVPRQNDTDVLVLKGQNFDIADELVINNLTYQETQDQIDEGGYQWLISLPNADLSDSLKDRLRSSTNVINSRGANVIEKISISVVAARSFGVLKSTLQIKIKILDDYYVASAFSAPIEDIAEITLKEIVFKRGFLDKEETFLNQQISTIRKDSNIENATPIDQLDLPVPVLKINIIGADGVKDTIKSSATKLSVYLNEHRREEINQKFGIQFFVNSVSLDTSKTLDKTVIYYRYEDPPSKRRFLKEALYLGRIIPGDLVVKRMLDQNRKTGVDIEIYVGKNLN